MVEIMDMENMGQNSVDSVIGIGDQWFTGLWYLLYGFG